MLSRKARCTGDRDGVLHAGKAAGIVGGSSKPGVTHMFHAALTTPHRPPPVF